jgi:Putative glycerate kinase
MWSGSCARRARGVRTPLSVASALGAMRAGLIPETPKPDHAAFANVAEPFIVGNTAALDAVAAAATEAGFEPVLLSLTPLQGDATGAGRVIAHALARAPRGSCLAWGGETTVRLPDDPGSVAAASNSRSLPPRCSTISPPTAPGSSPRAPTAATVRRDRPARWSRGRAGARARGRTAIRPARSGRCDAHAALVAAGANLPARETGTNVMDIVVALRV